MSPLSAKPADGIGSLIALHAILKDCDIPWCRSATGFLVKLDKFLVRLFLVLS
jgi:hypothetical protein